MKAIEIFDVLRLYSDEVLGNPESLERLLLTEIPVFLIEGPDGTRQIAWRKGKYAQAAYEFADPLPYLVGLQNPWEFANFLCLLFKYRNKITRYIEVGTYKGATFYLVDSYLRRVAPNYEKGIGIDLFRTPMELDEYQGKFQVEFFKQSSKDLKFEYQPGTVTFIDGNHKAGMAKSDFDQYGPWSDIVGMHDVGGLRAVKWAWQRVVPSYPDRNVMFYYPARYPDSSPMGIGAVIMPTAEIVSGALNSPQAV